MEESQGHESNDAFPLPLNPLFDLSALVMVSKKAKATLKENLQFGTSLKGAFYEDFATLRVQELAKIKGNKLVLSKTKLEIAIIRPGSLSDDGIGDSIKRDEDRIKLLKVLVSEKIKGQ